jgi:starch phosphorylase
MMLERMKEEVDRGTPFDEALRKIRGSTVFTTHTPVPAGHDVFSIDLVDKYLSDYYALLGIKRDSVLKLGQADHNDSGFNMTALALATSEHCNAVSRLHGVVARRSRATVRASGTVISTTACQFARIRDWRCRCSSSCERRAGG